MDDEYEIRKSQLLEPPWQWICLCLWHVIKHLQWKKRIKTYPRKAHSTIVKFAWQNLTNEIESRQSCASTFHACTYNLRLKYTYKTLLLKRKKDMKKETITEKKSWNNSPIKKVNFDKAIKVNNELKVNVVEKQDNKNI